MGFGKGDFMIKTKEMDKFIKELAKAYNNNPNANILSDTIYDALQHYDFSNEEFENRNIRVFFSTLQHNFSDSNLKVYVSEYQNRFLQFSSELDDAKTVKMYLSFPKEYIYQAAVKIFAFISNNKMQTGSKLADQVRSDSIVLRLQNPEDAKKVLEFINRDKELIKYSKKVNPFCLKEGIVGISYDYQISYNSTLASLLSYYLNILKANDNLKKASLKGFSEYVNNIYNSTFVTKETLMEFTESEVYTKFQRRLNSPGALLNNFEQVIRIIKDVTNNKLTKDKYFTMINEFKNDYDKERYYNQVYSSELGKTQTNILNSYIDYAIHKYGVEDVHLYLDSYISENVNAITNDNGYRDLFARYIPFDDLESLVNNDSKQYVNNFINNMANESNYYLFLTACVETAKKYDVNQAAKAVKAGMNGNFEYFTNGPKKLRDRLSSFVRPDEIIRFINDLIPNNEHTVNFDIVIYNFIESLIGNKEREKNVQRL